MPRTAISSMPTALLPATQAFTVTTAVDGPTTKTAQWGDIPDMVVYAARPALAKTTVGLDSVN